MIALQYNYLGNLQKAFSYNIRGMSGVIEKRNSKVREIVSNLLWNKRDIQWADSNESNSEVEDGYDSDEDLLSRENAVYRSEER